MIRPPTFLYFGALIWYGNVIPSCYLINSNDTKKFIMEKGWIAMIFELYKKRKPKEVKNSETKAAAKGDINTDRSNVSNDDSDGNHFEKKTSALKILGQKEHEKMKSINRQSCQNCTNCKMKDSVRPEKTNDENCHQQPHCSKSSPKLEEPQSVLPNQPDYS